MHTTKTHLHNEITQLIEYLNSKILGQPTLVQRMIIALLSDGHILVEGAPGLAKTKAIKELSHCIEGDYHRIQFTPDLLPADLTGTEIYRQEEARFEFQKGPIFHNMLLADEINRAPAKVQSALLEAMEERQVSIGRSSYKLPQLFMVMATQNPIEQEGTYPLPEAQLDRFLMHIRIDYPESSAERSILELSRQEALNSAEGLPLPKKKISQNTLFAIRKSLLRDIHMSEAIENYIVELILATRTPHRYDSTLGSWANFGASPRATISLDRTSRALAWLKGRDYVTPEDVQAVLHDVLRHRIILSYEAQAQGVHADVFISEILNYVAIP